MCVTETKVKEGKISPQCLCLLHTRKKKCMQNTLLTRELKFWKFHKPKYLVLIN